MEGLGARSDTGHTLINKKTKKRVAVQMSCESSESKAIQLTKQRQRHFEPTGYEKIDDPEWMYSPSHNLSGLHITISISQTHTQPSPPSEISILFFFFPLFVSFLILFFLFWLNVIISILPPWIWKMNLCLLHLIWFWVNKILLLLFAKNTHLVWCFFLMLQEHEVTAGGRREVEIYINLTQFSVLWLRLNNELILLSAALWYTHHKACCN